MIWDDPLFVYYCSYFVVSVLGVCWSPFFFSYHVLDLVNHISLLAYALQAVKESGFTLLATFVLGVIILYIFSIISFVFFRNQYNMEGISDCGSMLNCFVMHIDYGLRAAPTWGIENGGGYMQRYSGGGHWAGPLLFDIIYNMIVVLILVAIISGVIIDKFSELREKKAKTDTDIRNVCFVCSINRDEFEKAAIKFDEHVHQDHSIESYSFFVMYLRGKDPTDFTMQEAYVASCLRREDTSFFPVLRTRKLEAFLKQDVHLGDIQAAVEKIGTQLTDTQKALAKLLK
jgi:inositol 1,4,5-triphosphate receptor type 1